MSDSGQEIDVRDEQGRLTGRFQLADGKLHGKSTLYDRGAVLAEINYVNGLRHGEMRSYGDNGLLLSVVPHAFDLPHGEASYFHPDGAIARRASYMEGRLHGEVRDYSPEGEELSCDTYVDGRKQDAPGKAPAQAGKTVEAQGRKSWLTRLVEG